MFLKSVSPKDLHLGVLKEIADVHLINLLALRKIQENWESINEKIINTKATIVIV